MYLLIHWFLIVFRFFFNTIILNPSVAHGKMILIHVKNGTTNPTQNPLTKPMQNNCVTKQHDNIFKKLIRAKKKMKWYKSKEGLPNFTSMHPAFPSICSFIFCTHFRSALLCAPYTNIFLWFVKFDLFYRFRISILFLEIFGILKRYHRKCHNWFAFDGPGNALHISRDFFGTISQWFFFGFG